jgi:hypothetical protein
MGDRLGKGSGYPPNHWMNTLTPWRVKEWQRQSIVGKSNFSSLTKEALI